jgi:hypothetical protein
VIVLVFLMISLLGCLRVFIVGERLWILCPRSIRYVLPSCIKDDENILRH